MTWKDNLCKAGFLSGGGRGGVIPRGNVLPMHRGTAEDAQEQRRRVGSGL